MRSVVVRCRRCGSALAGPLEVGVELVLDAATVPEISRQYQGLRDLVLPGEYVIADEAAVSMLDLWGVKPGDVLTNWDDPRSTVSVGRVSGCCGIDGLDRPNLGCPSGHSVGTEVNDCMTPRFVVYEAACVVADPRGTGA